MLLKKRTDSIVIYLDGAAIQRRHPNEPVFSQCSRSYQAQLRPSHEREREKERDRKHVAGAHLTRDIGERKRERERERKRERARETCTARQTETRFSRATSARPRSDNDRFR